MRRLRNWSTPLAAAVFAIMAATGIAMFFDVGTPGGETLHTWLGWGLVTAVLAHLATNWPSMKTHARRNGTRAMFATGLVVAILAVVPWSRPPESPTRSVYRVVAHAPLTTVAPLAGRDVASLVSDLRARGFGAATPESTIDALAGEDDGKRAQVIEILFPPRRS